MAKRRIKHHRTKRHRKVGLTTMSPANPLIVLGSLALGYLAGDTISAKLDAYVPTTTVPAVAATATTPAVPAVVKNVVSDTVLGASEMGAGALLYLQGPKKIWSHVVAGFTAGVGLRLLLKDEGVVTGFQSVPVIGNILNGFQKVPVVGKIPNALKGGFITNRTAAMGIVPNMLRGGFITNRTAAMGGMGNGLLREGC